MRFAPTDIAIDHSQNEIYVSSQGVKGANSGVSIYDATTHEFKKFIPVGTQALALDNERGERPGVRDRLRHRQGGRD